MCIGINPLRYQSGGREVRWVCPRGHEEEDDTPLLSRAYCRECDRVYEWDEVVQRGRAAERERVPMPAGLAAGD